MENKHYIIFQPEAVPVTEALDPAKIFGNIKDILREISQGFDAMKHNTTVLLTNLGSVRTPDDALWRGIRHVTPEWQNFLKALQAIEPKIQETADIVEYAGKRDVHANWDLRD